MEYLPGQSPDRSDSEDKDGNFFDPLGWNNARDRVAQDFKIGGRRV